jgi:hypothetical protein
LIDTKKKGGGGGRGIGEPFKLRLSDHILRHLALSSHRSQTGTQDLCFVGINVKKIIQIDIFLSFIVLVGEVVLASVSPFDI